MGKKANKNKHKKPVARVEQHKTEQPKISEDSNNPLLLHYAAKDGDLELIERLIKKGYDVNRKEFFEQSTPLIIAALYGHLEIVKLLLSNGANLELSDIDNVAPLQAAGNKNYVDVTEVLIEAGADINKIHKDGATLLHVAAELGYTEIIIALLKSENIDINARHEHTGVTALWISAFRGYTDIVDILLSKNANIHLGHINGITPLHVAAKGGYLEIIELLVQYGSFLNATDNFGTPLYYASSQGKTDAVKLLIHEGADVNFHLNKEGQTPLYCAVSKGYAELVKTLIEAGADVNFISAKGNVRLIDLAIALQNVEIVRELINTPTIKILDQDGSTPLHLAAECGYDKLIPILLESRKIDINHRDVAKKATPLLIAAAYGNLEVIRKLINEGADVGIADDSMCTPLHVAALRSYVDIVKILLVAKVDINARAEGGYTALHFAIGNKELVKLLLKDSANPLLQNNAGMTPLHMALEKGHKDTVKILTKYVKNFTEQKEVVNVIEDITHLKIWHMGIKYGKIDIIKPLLLSGTVGINSRDHTGSTALHYAAYNEYLEIIELLIRLGNLDVNVQDYKERATPLHLAAANNKVGVINTLLGIRDTDIDAVAREGTALCSAVFKNREEAALRLIEAGADVNKANFLGHTPLHAAVHKGYGNMVSILLSSPNINANLMDIQGITPLVWAIKTQRIDIVDILVQSGKVDVNIGLNAYPIYLAIISGNIQIIKTVLQIEGIDLDITASDNHYTALHFAAYLGNAEIIKMLVQAKTNKDSMVIAENKEEGLLDFFISYMSLKFFNRSPRDNMFKFKGNELSGEIYKGTTPLHIAISRDHTDAAITLITFGINLNIADGEGAFAIHLAVSKGNIDVFGAMLASGYLDVNVQSLDKGITALHCAVATRNITIVIELLKVAGINLDIIGWHCVTPLLLAIKNNDFVISKLLVEAGANVNLGYNDLTPLLLAIFSGNRDIIELIIKSEGFDCEYNLEFPKTKSIPLNVAIETGQEYLVNLLLEYGVNINSVDYYGSSALHAAVALGNVTIINTLLRFNINVNIANKKGATALHIATIQNNLECLRVLIANGADVNAQNEDGVTALAFATVHGHLGVAEYLLESGTDFSIVDNLQYMTPLHIAAKYNQLEILKLLLDNFAVVNVSNLLNVTPLHLAAISGNVEAISLLASKGADINAIDTSGETALHYAAFYGNLAAVKILEESGANVKILNEDGHLASHLASSQAIRQYLFSKEKLYKAAISKSLKLEDKSNSIDSKELEGSLEQKTAIPKVKKVVTVAHAPREYLDKIDYLHKNYHYQYKNPFEDKTKIYTWSINNQKISSNSDSIQKISDINGNELYVTIADKVQTKLDSSVLMKFKRAIDNGFVGAIGENGIKKIKNKIIVVKINEDVRLYTETIYLNPDNKKLIIFDNFCIHSQLQRKINSAHLEIQRVDAAYVEESTFDRYQFPHDDYYNMLSSHEYDILGQYAVDIVGDLYCN